MKIGILGGTLDPVHNGHIAVALEAMAALGLNRVMLLPAGDPPHKARPTPKLDRLRMAEIAARTQPGFFASDLEIRREGTTYTVDTLSELSERQPDVEWTYIVGADTLDILDSWKDFPRIARLCAFAAVQRPGSDPALTERRAAALEAQYGARITVLPVRGPDISSTDIRRSVAEGNSADADVPAGVARYIRGAGLYLCDYTERQLLEMLQARLSAHRFAHTLGVAWTAQRQAPRFGVETRRARLAGLLHDCAKGMPIDEMRALVAESVPDADPEELGAEAILHAPAGMLLAARDYGVRDPAILSAIRKHTVGDGEMSAMDALIYVADFIEPGRGPFPGLDKARQAAEEDIYRAMRVCASLTAEYLRSRGQTVHPRTLRLLNAYQEG